MKDSKENQKNANIDLNIHENCALRSQATVNTGRNSFGVAQTGANPTLKASLRLGYYLIQPLTDVSGLGQGHAHDQYPLAVHIVLCQAMRS
jgi:hypothetical protein